MALHMRCLVEFANGRQVDEARGCLQVDEALCALLAAAADQPDKKWVFTDTFLKDLNPQGFSPRLMHGPGGGGGAGSCCCS